MSRPLSLLVMTTAFALGSAGPLHAQTDEPTPRLDAGVVVFYDYTLTSPAADASGSATRARAFDVTRTYLNLTGQAGSFVRFRVTPDIAGWTSTGSRPDAGLTFRLKYAYAHFDLGTVTGRWTGTWVRAGIQPTPFIGDVDDVYRYRFQGTTFAERDGALISADAGLSARTDLPGSYGDVHIGIYNGEGYAHREVDDQKAVLLRTTIRPVPDVRAWLHGLRVTTYVHRDHVKAGAERHRAIGALWFEHARLNAGLEYLTRDDRAEPDTPRVTSRGWSVFVTPFLETKGDGLELLFRYDTFTSDTSTPTGHRRAIAGAAYWMPHASGRGTAALMLDIELLRQRLATTDRPNERRVTVHGLIAF